jgi:cell shape-determining protein MreD
MSMFQQAKLVAMEVTHLGKDALHVHVGLALMLLTAIVFRKSLRDWLPLAAALLAALAGEIWDLIDAFAHGQTLRWNASAKDVVNTFFWPLILFLLARFTRLLKR